MVKIHNKKETEEIDFRESISSESHNQLYVFLLASRIYKWLVATYEI